MFKEIFYALCSILLLSVFYTAFFEAEIIKSDRLKLSNYKNFIVVDKERDFFYGNVLTVTKNEERKLLISCDGIIFNSISIGDTLK